MTLIRGDALDSQTPARTRVLCIASQMLCLVNLVYAGRFGVNPVWAVAWMLAARASAPCPFLLSERELVPSPRESTRPWRLAEPV